MRNKTVEEWGKSEGFLDWPMGNSWKCENFALKKLGVEVKMRVGGESFEDGSLIFRYKFATNS